MTFLTLVCYSRMLLTLTPPPTHDHEYDHPYSRMLMTFLILVCSSRMLLTLTPPPAHDHEYDHPYSRMLMSTSPPLAYIMSAPLFLPSLEFIMSTPPPFLPPKNPARTACILLLTNI